MVNTDSGMDLPQKVTWESGSILWSQFNQVGPETLIYGTFFMEPVYIGPKTLIYGNFCGASI